MKTKNLPTTQTVLKGFTAKTLAAIVVVAFAFNTAKANTYTSNGDGNWSTPSMWSPSGPPQAGDDVVIRSGDVVTVNGNYTCAKLSIGSSGNSDATVRITSAGNSLTITDDLKINTDSKNRDYELDAGPGTINIEGNIVHWSTTGNNQIKVGSGTLNFTQPVTLSNSKHDIVFTGAGTIVFNDDFTDNYNGLTTFAGCTVIIGDDYSVNTTTADWASKGTAVFRGNNAIVTANSNLILNSVSVNAGADLTFSATGSGTIVANGDMTFGSASDFTVSKNFVLGGNWTNNGVTLNASGRTITLNGASGTIDGTSSTSFPTIQLGNTTTAVSYTMNNNNTCNYLVFNANTAARTLALGSGDVLTVNNNITINQPTASSVTNLLSVGAGTCNVSGNLVFSGTNSTTTRVAKVDVTSGAFSVTGSVTWMGNTAVATEVITVSTGTVTFGSSLTMGSASGTLAVTGTGTINFNGSTAPSFTFGGATAPVFTTTNGCTLNFAKGFTNSTSALTLAATSQTNITGTGTITPTAAITFGHLGVNASYTGTFATGTVTVAGDVTIGSSATLALNQNLQVGGNWTNNGGTLSATGRTITFNGTTKTIGGTGTTAFPAVIIGKSGGGAVTVSYTMNNDNSMTSLSFDGNTLPRSLTLGAGKTLTISGDLTVNQPTIAAYTNLFDISAGTCNISGNMTFAGSSTTATKVAKLNVTSGNFTLEGTLTWMSATSVATEVIAVGNGTLNFESPISLTSGTGTIDINGAATVNFNGATTPSFTFGGTTTPVFNIASGSALNFAKGFSSPTTALTFPAGSTVTSGSVSSPVNFTVTGSNTITNSGNMTVYGDLVGTIPGSAFVNGANGNLTVYGSVMPTGTFTASAAGNTVTYAGSGAQSVKTGTYNSLILSGAGAKTLSGNITAADVTLSSASLDDAGYTITVTGANGWTNNSGTYTTTGGVSFTGATASQIGGTSATTFKNLTLNKSGGVTLNAPVTVDGALTLTNGVITTSATNYLKLAAAATASTGSASTYVEGPMIKVGNTAFTFPLGHLGRWRRVGVSGMTNAATQVTAQYFAATPPNKNSRNSTIGEVSSEEYWDVDRTVTSDPVKITLYWESKPLQSLSLDCSSLVIAHYKNGAWQRETSTLKSSALSCLLGGSGSMETDWVSSFSPFGFGGDGGGGLPIKLVSFDAVPNGKVVETTWITELEINNAYFTLERSTDVENWEEVARVDGAGNSTNLLTYEKADVNPKIGTTYYRLKQTDFDGQFTYSNIVPVTIEGVKSNFTVYPNPTDNEMTLHVENPSDEISVTIYDLTGRKMYSRMFGVDKGNNTHEITIQAKYLLPTGVYMMSVSTNGTEHRERVVLN